MRLGLRAGAGGEARAEGWFIRDTEVKEVTNTRKDQPYSYDSLLTQTQEVTVAQDSLLCPGVLLRVLYCLNITFLPKNGRASCRERV